MYPREGTRILRHTGMYRSNGSLFLHKIPRGLSDTTPPPVAYRSYFVDEKLVVCRRGLSSFFSFFSLSLLFLRFLDIKILFSFCHSMGGGGDKKGFCSASNFYFCVGCVVVLKSVTC